MELFSLLKENLPRLPTPLKNIPFLYRQPLRCTSRDEVADFVCVSYQLIP